MANDTKYGKNRNLWRRVYGFKRRKPVTKQFVDSNTGVTFSLDLQNTLRHRDYFIIQTTATASITTPSTAALGQYDEGLISFNNADYAVSSFNFCFSNTPDAVVLTVEPGSNFDDNVIAYGLTFNSCSMSIGLSAPYSGSVRYRAVYSSTGYPVDVTSSFAPSSGTFQVSAGHITASNEQDYLFTYSLSGTPIVRATSWDFFGNFDVDVSLNNLTKSSTQTSGSISAPLNNVIYFIASN